jgi:hypothetical protein
MHSGRQIATWRAKGSPVTAVTCQVTAVILCFYLAKSPDYFLTKLTSASGFRRG